MSFRPMWSLERFASGKSKNILVACMLEILEKKEWNAIGNPMPSKNNIRTDPGFPAGWVR